MTTPDGPPLVEGLGDRGWLILGALIALAATVAASEPFPAGMWVDDGHYVLLARALAAGDGYRYVNLPGQPYAVHFPPGYPAVLALLGRFGPGFPQSLGVFVFANAVFTAMAAWGAAALGVRVLGLRAPAAAIAAVTWAIAVPSLMLSTVVLSEPLFLALLFPALLVAERAVRDGGARNAALAGVLIAACTLVRSVGVAALVAAGLALCLRRRWRELVILAATTAVALAPWAVWKRLHQTELPSAVAGMYGDYGAWLSQGLAEHGLALPVQVVSRNAGDIVEAFARYWSMGPDGAVRLMVAAALLLLTALGVVTSWRRGPVATCTLVVYLLIVLVWPFHPQRFVWGIGALWILLCYAGGLWLWRAALRSAQPSVRAAVAYGLIAVALTLPVASARAIPARDWTFVPRSGLASVLPMMQWTVQHTPTDAVLASDSETFIYLYTGRRAVPYVPFKASDRAGLMTAAEAYAGFAEVLERYRPRWVLALNLPSVRVAEHFTANAGAPLRRIAVPRHGAVYEVRGPQHGTTGSDAAVGHRAGAGGEARGGAQ